MFGHVIDSCMAMFHWNSLCAMIESLALLPGQVIYCRIMINYFMARSARPATAGVQNGSLIGRIRIYLYTCTYWILGREEVTYKGVVGCASKDALRPSFHPLTPNPYQVWHQLSCGLQGEKSSKEFQVTFVLYSGSRVSRRCMRNVWNVV